MKRPANGWRVDKGWLFLSIYSHVYLFHLEIGRFSLAMLHDKKTMDRLSTERRARYEELKSKGSK